MNPRHATEAECAFWATQDEAAQFSVVIGGPEEAPDVIPCPALVSDSEPRLVRVAYDLDMEEVAGLKQGGTLWLTTWGSLPVHKLTVVVDGGSS